MSDAGYLILRPQRGRDPQTENCLDDFHIPRLVDPSLQVHSQHRRFLFISLAYSIITFPLNLERLPSTWSKLTEEEALETCLWPLAPMLMVLSSQVQDHLGDNPYVESVHHYGVDTWICQQLVELCTTKSISLCFKVTHKVWRSQRAVYTGVRDSSLPTNL